MDATIVKLSNVKITGKLRDTETVMRSLEGGGWKSANTGNSLATYLTASTVSDGRGVAVMHTSTLTEVKKILVLSTVRNLVLLVLLALSSPTQTIILVAELPEFALLEVRHFWHYQ
jgi:hypothetical protein